MTNIQAIDLLKGLEQSLDDYCELNDEGKTAFRMAITALEVFGISEQLPSTQPERKWTPVSKKLPDDLEEVNITFTNLAPEPYYDFIKGKRFTGSAVFYKGEWYWYSSITVDVLKEYGRYESEKIDEGLKVVAWRPLPDPYGGE